MYRLNIATAELTMEGENPGDYVGWMVDNAFVVRGAVAALEDGGYELLLKNEAREQVSFMTWGPEDQQQTLGFTPDNKGLYLEDSVGSNTTQFYEMDIATREKKVIAAIRPSI